MTLSDRRTKIGLFGGMRPFNTIQDKSPSVIGNLFDAQVKNITDYSKIKNNTNYGQIKRIG
jgi:hypothetical protein